MYQRIDNQVVSDDWVRSIRGHGPLVAYLMLPEGQLVLGGHVGCRFSTGCLLGCLAETWIGLRGNLAFTMSEARPWEPMSF